MGPYGGRRRLGRSPDYEKSGFHFKSRIDRGTIMLHSSGTIAQGSCILGFLNNFRCEVRSWHPDRVEFYADQLAQSVQRAPAPGRSDRFVRALVSPVSALLRARRRTAVRTWCRGGCQLHLALGAGLCTRADQTLPTASQADEQELSNRRDLYQG